MSEISQQTAGEMLAVLQDCREWAFIRKFPHDERIWKALNGVIEKAEREQSQQS